MIKANKTHIDPDQDGDYSVEDLLVYLQWIMMLAGAVFNAIVLMLCGPICKLVY
jgi:hypothetical protein